MSGCCWGFTCWGRLPAGMGPEFRRERKLALCYGRLWSQCDQTKDAIDWRVNRRDQWQLMNKSGDGQGEVCSDCSCHYTLLNDKALAARNTYVFKSIPSVSLRFCIRWISGVTCTSQTWWQLSISRSPMPSLLVGYSWTAAGPPRQVGTDSRLLSVSVSISRKQTIWVTVCTSANRGEPAKELPYIISK